MATFERKTMTSVAYLFRKDFDNPGDLYSCIMHYLFPDRSGIMLDVYHTDIPTFDVDIAIVGGGAILSTRKFINDIDEILSKVNAKYKIVWGVGYNPDLKDHIQTNFDLIGVRDSNVIDYDWVPCPSVLHLEIQRHYDTVPTKDFLIIDHWKRPVEFDGKCTRIDNKPNNIHNVIRTIADHRYVLTSSYHAAYWATLLKKQTFVIGNELPGKFYTMKHSPVIASQFNYGLIDQATIYDNAYEDCLLATRNFKEKVENLTGVEFALRNTFNSQITQSPVEPGQP